jgi:hypothetical protein
MVRANWNMQDSIMRHWSVVLDSELGLFVMQKTQRDVSE